MKIGIDYHNVAHKFPGIVKLLSESHDVYILSGIGRQRISEIRLLLKDVPVKKILSPRMKNGVYSPSERWQVKRWKLKQCRNLRLNLYIDDDADVCRWAKEDRPKMIVLRVLPDRENHDFCEHRFEQGSNQCVKCRKYFSWANKLVKKSD